MTQTKQRLFVKTALAEEVDLEGKTIIVTGASPGSLGFATSRVLALWGATVIATARKNTEATRASLLASLPGDAGGRVKVTSLDLCDPDSVARFEQWYHDSEGDQLDVLINNAGVHLDIMSEWKEPHLTGDGYEVQWRTNYLGTLHLTHLLLPALKKAGQRTGDARIVNVVSKLHFKGSNSQLFEKTEPYNSWKAYGGSKLALVHATLEAQRRFADRDGVRSYCLHPGSVSTNVADKGLEGTLAQRARRALLSVEGLFLRTPEEGAQTQIYCATAPHLPGGVYYEDCEPADVSPESGDAAVAGRLWDETANWVSTL